jgi:Na+:H+ antiporter, NhaA family
MPVPEPPPIPGALTPARRLATAIAGPISTFLHIQAASGILLLVASAAALFWANSPWHAAYEHLWHVPLTVGVADISFSKPIHFWINDVLMVVFFFVVGLEIRREVHAGELSNLRRASLPALAALGGMIAPAALYLVVNHASPGKAGWGVPMATDIAFAVGVLALLGKRVPEALRVLLLALAIIDDIGAILVIAAFYSTDFSWIGLGIAAAGVAGVLVLQSIGARRPVAYILPGLVVWLGFYRAGIHPTIAGVVVGLLTPARPWYGVGGFVESMRSATDELHDDARRTREHEPDRAPHEVIEVLERVGEARREAVAPAIRIEAVLHPWVAYGIMPLFAFANAGVRVTDVELGGTGSFVILVGVVLGLCVGKPLGVVLATLVAVKTGITSLPRAVTWRGIAVVGLVAGIGFTMAIFIASLAFADQAMLATAKLAVLIASAAAGLGALLAGRLLLPAGSSHDAAAVTAEQAECSTDE